MSDTPRATITDHGAFAAWASEHYPERCSVSIVVPMTRVASERFQRARETLSLIATRFDTEVDPFLLPDLLADGQWRDGDFYARADGELVPGVRMEMAA